MRSTVVAALVLSGAACSDGRSPWCDRLAGQKDLGDLVAAVGGEDTAAAEAALGDLEALAADAPAPVRDDMDAVVEALRDVVELRLAPDDVPAGEIENRRARVNQRLEEVAVPTAAVGRWAETECGITLD